MIKNIKTIYDRIYNLESIARQIFICGIILTSFLFIMSMILMLVNSTSVFSLYDGYLSFSCASVGVSVFCECFLGALVIDALIKKNGN